MLYMEIYNYDGESNTHLNIHSNIKYNNLFDNVYGYKYMFETDLNSNNKACYEPFIIDEDTGGFTIVDDEFGEDIVNSLVMYILKMLGFDSKYKVTVRYVDYDVKDLLDESNREQAMNAMLKMLGYVEVKKSSFVKQLINKISNGRR